MRFLSIKIEYGPEPLCRFRSVLCFKVQPLTIVFMILIVSRISSCSGFVSA